MAEDRVVRRKHPRRSADGAASGRRAKESKLTTVSAGPPATRGELRLSNSDPEVEPMASRPGRFMVKFKLEGVDLRELETAITPRLAAVGVDAMRRFGMTVSLDGVEPGREAEIQAVVQGAINDVNRARGEARLRAGDDRSASEDAAAASESALRAVRESFHAARRSAHAVPLYPERR
jgi:hypothetical protein